MVMALVGVAPNDVLLPEHCPVKVISIRTPYMYIGWRGGWLGKTNLGGG